MIEARFTQRMKAMKKLVWIVCIVLTTSSSQAAGFKTCLFHDIPYAYVPQFNFCPWNIGNLPPEADNYPPGPHHHSAPDELISVFSFNKPNRPQTEIIHSPECFGEHNGGMN